MIATLFVLSTLGLQAAREVPSFEAELLAQPAATLLSEARQSGDAQRGAELFDHPALACGRCHAVGGGESRLGPDLARLGPDTTAVSLVDSVLRPSSLIRKGFETIAVMTKSGQVVTGLLAEDGADALVLRDPTRLGETLKVLKADIEERRDDGPSLMPTGLVNGLSSRTQFLDLVRFLVEVHEGGPERARSLRPTPPPLASISLPEYERDLDHAGLISGLDTEGLKRGEAIFQRVCANCHGTKDREGSLPLAPRFARPKVNLRNGPDPYSMYRTLTHGFGMMPAQTWLVPKQRYDVIHYLREILIKENNPELYTKADVSYLKGLPKGASRGPGPSAIEPWVAMDYGRAMLTTIEVGRDASNIAYKGIAVRLDDGPGGVSLGRAWALYEHDTMRLAAYWTGKGFIDWEGIHFDGRHQAHPRIVGDLALANTNGPGWASPRHGSFEDPRMRGRDGRAYGPLPRDWALYRGLYEHGDRVVLEYEVGGVQVLESPGIVTSDELQVLARHFEVGPRTAELTLRVAEGASEGPANPDVMTANPRKPLVLSLPRGKLMAAVVSVRQDLTWKVKEGGLLLSLPPGDRTLRFTLFSGRVGNDEEETTARALVEKAADPIELIPFTRGGPTRWPGTITTRLVRGPDDGPYAVDMLELPEHNPWNALVRPTGFDFLSDGKALMCTWDGDVWHVSGINQGEGVLTWRRVASGMFQPLGLKVLKGRVFVTCRDQIVELVDEDGDGEYEHLSCFNSDHQVTEHFHEFAMGLQADAAGNLYYAKAGRHGLPALVPQHGTLLRVTADGSRTDILATGFRAPNGVCLNDDGTFFVSDQEGFWLPKNRINWVRPGTFHGNMWGYHDLKDPSDTAMEPPVCWITNRFDRSPAELVRVVGDRWGLPDGTLLNLSYGEGKLFVVPHERVGDRMQGGMCALPIAPLPTGVMRGRFSGEDGQLYACGMFAWAGNRTLPGGMYRIRATGEKPCLPLGLHPRAGALDITFSKALRPDSLRDLSSFTVRVWGLKRSQNYGSPHVDEHPLNLAGASLSEDGKTLSLALPELTPTWCMEVIYKVRGVDGKVVEGTIHNTIHELAR